MWNYAEIWQKCVDFTKFLNQTYSETNINDHVHTELVQKNLACAPFTLITIISLWSWSIIRCPVLAESNSQLARVSASQYLKFSDDTRSFAMLPTE